MSIFIYFIVVIIILYNCLIGRFILGWISTKTYKIPEIQHLRYTEFVSVIIAARNEANSILFLLTDIYNQNYPADLYEVIVVDDNSTDDTAQIVSKFCENQTNLKLLSIKKPDTGKKNALSEGIRHAKGELIITTDADCRISKEWISTLVSYYTKTKATMIVAPVEITSSPRPAGIFQWIFSNMQSLEFMSLFITTAGAVASGRPIMCNGANLAYKKTAYTRLIDPISKKNTSGDDVFLLLNLKKNKNKIAFIKSRKVIIKTNPQYTIKNFINQRKRWTSKSPSYNDPDIIYTAIIVFLMSLVLIISFIIACYNINYLSVFLFLFFTKSVVDFIALYLATKFFNRTQLLCFLIPVQLIYPFYIVFTAIAGNFSGFKWKNQNYNK